MKRPSIAILGTRGVPACYSGFETSAEETAARFTARGYETTVYCRRSHYSSRPASHRGARLVFTPSIRTKHLDTATHTLASVLHLLRRRRDVAILYGLGNAPLIPLLRACAIPVIVVLDGADWRRQKWGAAARLYLRAARRLAVGTADRYVIDSEELAREYARQFSREPVYIPYGAAPSARVDDGVLRELRLTERGYLIFVGRFVREKGIELLLEAFRGVPTDARLVVVGGNPLDGEYERRLRGRADERVLFPGMIYGPRYETLLARARFYVSCSALEGTSPSLLSAMALNGFAVVADIPENRETLKGTCATFRAGDVDDLRAKLARYLERPQEVERERERTRATVLRHYDWERIAERYLELVDELAARRREGRWIGRTAT